MDARGIEPEEVIPATRKLGRDAAEKLVRDARQIVVARGRKVQELRGGSYDEEVVKAMLGPTGNLRAPTARAGKTVLVGFNEEAWRSVFGS
jgi:arsenate reductase-like glutaredoxin family protein